MCRREKYISVCDIKYIRIYNIKQYNDGILDVRGHNGEPNYPDIPGIKYAQNPAPSQRRCGVCPTYFQKVCAFDSLTNSTSIFDNICIMDLQNCLEGNHFVTMKYEHCVYFGNFAYVHGYKFTEMDYGEDHVKLHGSKKNPDFIRRMMELNENIFELE